MKIYKKQNNKILLLEVEKEALLSANFSNLPNATEQEILDYELQEAKDYKLAQLDKNRNDFCLIPIEYQGNTYATTINAWAAISYLANGLATLSTETQYPNLQGDNITLTKADFKAIAALIQAREMSSRDLRKSRADEIESITADGQYFNNQETPQLITPIEAVNAISTIF